MKELVNNVEIEVVYADDTFLVSNKDVATAFGVSEPNIRTHKSNKSELIEGKHFIEGVGNTDSSTNQKRTMWTQKGIVRLGMMLRPTEFTIAFRDWAEDYIINGGEVTAQLTDDQIVANALQITAKRVEALTCANELLVGRNQKLYNEKEAIIEDLQERDNIIEAISDRSRKFSIDEWSGMINDKERIFIGQNRLFRVLRDLGYFKNGNNPKQIYREQGLFDIHLHKFTLPSGEVKTSSKPLVTYKGMDKLTPIVIEYWLENE